ncbi:BapA/Bap/LapF family large adhesin [Sphingomonas sp. 22R3R2A-7]|uniref:BapA/Bap/LapF family large adhesin n=1 Tax=Sphingomonas sp. 22R3R2A-7 TaxID=3050230 RepID=UPI002FDFCC44
MGADGSYVAVLSPAQIDGEVLSVRQADAAGNVSPPADAAAPDLVVTAGPDAPTAAVGADGSSVAGTAAAGATVTVFDAAGVVIGTGVAGADGGYGIALAPPRTDGETIRVTQTDANGAVSPPVTAIAPDLTAPDAPAAVIDATGSVVTGTGQPGATVTVRAADGTVIGTATAGANGAFAVTLTPAQTDGTSVAVTQADGAGNVSAPSTIATPDFAVPLAPTAIVSADGSAVTGGGEAGATVVVRDSSGVVLGSGTAGADGAFTVRIAPAQANGETLSVTVSDAGGNVSPATVVTAPDITAPALPVAQIDGDGGTVAGTGEPGATITVRDATDTVIGTAIVAADGSYSVTLTPAQTNAETVRVSQVDAAGNVSASASVVAPDFTAPAQPSATIAGDGASVSGTGEPGAAILITGATGVTLGTAVVAGDGSYTAPLDPAQANGEALRVVQTDAAGNASAPLPLTAPDITAPPAPGAILDPSGAVVTGTGEIGARVTVVDGAGTLLGSALVTAQGNYSITLSTPQIDSQALSVTQRDAAGNLSPATGLTAPDITAPGAPVAQVGADGGTVTGTGEPGATVVVRAPLGGVVGTAIVNADGSYSVAVTPAQIDGEVLVVRQTDAAGNVSPIASAVAPDLVADTAPDAPTATVGSDGASVGGAAIAGAVITVYDATGTQIGTGVANPDGSYAVALNPARIDGEIVRVTQTDADGDVSPPATATAPDLTAPAAPTAAIDNTGAVVTGTGEPGATITIRAADTTLVGTATVGANGAYAATLTTIQIDGEALSVAQIDVAGNASQPIALRAPDFTVPAAPVVQIGGDGSVVTGTGEAGATVTVRDAANVVIGTATVAADGSFTATLTPAQANGGTISVVQADAAGNVSATVPLAAPDITPPAIPVAQIANDGSVVTGTGEAGATVTVRDAANVVIGTATVATDGSFTATLTPAKANGGTISVVQADAAGNVSAATPLVAPDITPPAVPVVQIANDGSVVTGTGEAGATVTVRDAANVVVGTAIVAIDGSFTATLTPAQANGGTISVVQADAAGNVSAAVPLAAPDITPPAVPVAQIANDGSVVTGTGEAGATVTVRDAANVVIGTAPVAADGSFTATLTPVQANGGTISVVQADAAGNASAAVPLAAPDITAPAVPVVQIANDGITVTGTGEAGASVTIVVGAVTVVTQVAGDGSFAATLSPAQLNGETITVTQADPAGNVSAAAIIVAPDLTVPAAPTATVAQDGASVVGAGEVGARIVVTNAAGGVVGVAVVADDGSYSARLDPPLLDGERLTATQTDGGGNISPPAVAVAPDLTAPSVPTLIVANDGASASGVGEAGATVTLRNPDGSVIGSVVAAGDGSFTFALSPPRLDGQILSATQADATGNVSVAAFDAAPDTTAPAAPTAFITTDGATVQGVGEPGATVTVSGVGGVPLGSGVVAADSSYSIALGSVQSDGQALLVSQRDPTGNVSPDTPVTAPDVTPPAAPTAIVAIDGASVTGVGEAGATVTIRDADGVPLGSQVVAIDGSYTVTLSPPQTDGELLSASQRDLNGNASPTTSVFAPDTTAPDVPVAIVSADGTFVTGRGEPGTTVTVTGAGGGTLGTATVGAGGTYAVALSSPQIDGQTLSVTLTDSARNVSLPATPIAPDGTAPLAPTASITADGTAAVGVGIVGSTITVTNAAGLVLGTAIVAADGSYTAPLDPPQRNGELLGVVQADIAGNFSPSIPAVAPDTTAPAAPAAVVGSEGTVVVGSGEPGATVTITSSGGAVLGTAVVSTAGAYVVTLATAQRNGETVVATQSDGAGNISGSTTAVAPDLTAPPPPTVTVIADDGTALTGRGEAGARVEVRAPDATLLGTTTVNADGSFAVGLVPAQTAGATLSVTQADLAGNVSLPSTIVAPFDISAFDNVDTAAVDLLPATTAVNLGQADYLALVSLNVVNLQAEVLTTGNVRFSVQQGHSLDAVFTFGTVADIEVAGSYVVAVQRLENGRWVSVNGTGAASLLEINVINGDLVATNTLGPGEYRAFATVQGGAAGVALLSTLNVTGVDLNFTAVAGAAPISATGNVITEAGPGGELDIVGPGTRVVSVTVNGVTTELAPGGSTVTGAWGTLTMNRDGSYSYAPTADVATIGKTDVFTYTLIDPTDGERASANLSITIGSPDIGGAPVAVADQAFADVTFQNVVTTLPPAQAFSFSAGLTGSRSGSFAVAPNTSSDITIVADRQAGLGLSVLPQYTVTIRNSSGATVRTASATAVANGLLGTSTFTFDDLPSGTYSYTVASQSTLSLGSFTTNVSLGSSTTFLDQFTLASAETATGNLLANDSANTAFAAIRVDAGGGFAEIGATPVTLTGTYGTLTVNETGGYVYQPSASLGYSAVDLTDSFTYQLVQPNGAASSAVLTVTIDVPADGPAVAPVPATLFAAFAAGEDGAIPLDALTLDSGESVIVTPDGAAIGLAAYDLFEGKGELEDVLSHYLTEPQADPASDTAEFVHPAAVENTMLPVVEDPFSFLATLPDQDQNGTVTNHVV